ncbi:uncharacterized protein Eint_070240 [Encephalitozoon intestinalis ATCC 50506]|uniref:Uncharacterized protein n=1 Tax=Encephalitozoon intestinalis (strain ATCC 50506) TaxID=876142 RepID=E0S7V3_ENCIT|nr:uncharacterized protein Eint_070240 [Encephalitozoon intestinalis ATCC 50506]ADM11788.1 hypothetical protein Eint_070240 [Encephalitozoon intestinalis ATCC 50506]UTX45536.1 PHO85 cyclin PHO80 [Encephalitozoon intestinalis]
MRGKSHLYSLLRKRCIRTIGIERKVAEDMWMPVIPSYKADSRNELKQSTSRIRKKSGGVDGAINKKTPGYNSASSPGSNASLRSYAGFPMDVFLVSIFGQERGIRFNFGLINSVILRFLDHRNVGSILLIESIFKVAQELPLVLISGYIYLEKYVKKIGIAFSNCKRLIKFFFVCCFMGLKFIFDGPSPSIRFLQEMNPREIFQIEKLVLSAIDYDLEISNGDIRRVFLQNKTLLSDKERLDEQFDKVTRNH